MLVAEPPQISNLKFQIPSLLRARMSEAAAGGKLVCVTGAAGYIASWLVKLLLRRGYTVRATVRDPNDPNKTEHLLALDGAKERLHLFKADLVEEGSFDSVVNGCVGVFHTASPIVLSVTDPQAELIDPAVKGTLNVLKSCAKFPSVRRVVVTSSLATVLINGRTLTEDVVVDETWFSDQTFCEEQKLWYMLSKVLAEEAACKFAKENGIDLVVFNPGVVIGPLLQPTLNFSVEIVMGFINGVQKFPATSYRFVDVRDVAFAHVQAFEIPSAEGRYCLVGKAVRYCEVLRILHDLYPTLLFPETSEEDKVVPMYLVSQEKAVGLGVRFMTLEESLRDTIEYLKAKKLLGI